MKLSHTTRVAVLITAASAHWSAVAADGGGTWRCGNTYTDQPCNGGRLVEVNDARDASQKRDADAATRNARAAADRMGSERQRLEAIGARSRPILIDNSPKRDGAQQASADKGSTSKLRKGKKEVLYTGTQAASVPPPEKKPKKAKKQKSGD